MKKKIAFLIVLTMTGFISSPVEAYNWQKHVPSEAREWQKKIPSEAHDWQKYVPSDVFSGSSKKGDFQKEYYGPTHISNEIKDRLVVYGPLRIEDSAVTGIMEVYGPLSADRSSFEQVRLCGPMNVDDVYFKSLDIDGVAKLNKATASGLISIRGYLRADNSHLQDIKAYSSELSLHDTSANDIIVKSQDSSSRQVVHLVGKTHVASIVFESGNGDVRIGPDASYGKLSGGSVQK